MSPAGPVSFVCDAVLGWELTVDGELTGGQGTDHEETGTDTAVRATDTELLGDLDQTASGSLTGSTLGLVDLGQHGVGGLGDDGSGETGDETGAQVVDGLHAVGGLALVDNSVDSLVDLLEDDELGHGVGDPDHMSATKKLETVGKNILLEQDGAEARVESTDTLVLEDLAEAANQTIGELGVRDETNTGGLKRAEGDVSDELSAGGRGKVDSGTVVGGGLVTEGGDSLLLEELVTSELEGTLEEVTGGGGAETSQESASALSADDLAEATDQTGVVGDGVKLDPGLDAGNGQSLHMRRHWRQLLRVATTARRSHWPQ
jgi:hypothetical protein